MKKYKVETIHRVLLCIIPLCIILILLNKYSIYGSSIDWVSQHVALPDYFRTIFLTEGKLYPEFALQLGGGQNFAQLTYYGFLRPDILLSFLFSNIEMTDFLQISGILYVLFSIQLFYQWVKNKFSKSWIALFISCLFALASPLIFHSHRHIMFMCYFPFLILSLIGVDRYVENKKILCLILGIFLMIISSYYFSVSGLAVIGLYGIFAWMKKYPKDNWKSFFSFLLPFCGWMIVGILLSGFYLIPTAMSIILQTRPALQSPVLSELIIPDKGFSSMLYGNYSIGLTAISVVALFYGLIKKNKAVRCLSIFLCIIVCIPIFQYILGGMQYIRAKALIPFLPVFTLLIGIMLDDWQQKKKKFPWFILIIALIQVFFITKEKQEYLYVIDIIMLTFLLLLFKRKGQVGIFLYILLPLALCIKTNFNESYATQKYLNKVDNPTKTALIKQTLNDNPGLYRFDDRNTSAAANEIVDLRQLKTTQYSSNSNMYYNNFFYQVMKQPMLNRNHVIIPSVSNPYFTGFMGVRFLYDYSENSSQYTYEIISKNGSHVILENEDVLPIAYVSYDIMSQKQFENISYPYSMETIYMNTIVDDKIEHKDFSSSIYEIYPELSLVEKTDNLTLEKTNDGMKIKSDGKSKARLRFNQKFESDQILIIQCMLDDVKNGDKKDVDVTINGVHNTKAASSFIYAGEKADFEYVIGKNDGFKNLSIKFTDGEYSLKDFKFYVADANMLKERKENVSAMSITENEDSVISGTVEAKEDGYFVTSIPYQKGLSIKIDGKEVESEKVNTAFLGAKITKGKHNIDIYYTLPGKELGKNVSVLSFLFIVLVIGKDKVKRKMKNGKCTNGK